MSIFLAIDQENRLYLQSAGARQTNIACLFHEAVSQNREDGLASRQPQGLGPETYLNSTPQGSGPEDARKDDYIRGRSKRFAKYPD